MPRRKTEDKQNTPKTVTVQLGVTTDDLDRLMKAFHDGKLKHFGVIDAHPMSEQREAIWTERESQNNLKPDNKSPSLSR
jgi:hypothetical protein